MENFKITINVDEKKTWYFVFLYKIFLIKENLLKNTS